MIKEYIHKIYILRDLKRYNNSLRIKEESVAEHSAFVSLIVLKLSEEYTFDINAALKMALTHDLSEIYVTDIPHNVKDRFPHVKEAIEIAEKNTFIKEFPAISSYFLELLQGTSTEAKIVQYADVLSCQQYAKSEMKLGNKSMQRVYDESVERATELEKELGDKK